MPEGDTVRKIAGALQARLRGNVLDRVRLRDRPDLDLSGRRVIEVRAHGKHLFIDLEGGLSLRSHLGMNGSWHRYAAGEPWRRPRRQASLELQVEADLFVCFNAKEIEALRSGSIRSRQYEARLGPDLTLEHVDFALVMARAEEIFDPGIPVMDLLMDQRPCSGIGNVYKCEILFLHGVHPKRCFGDLPDGTLESMYRMAQDLLRQNLHEGPRVTRPAEDVRQDHHRHWVYGRLDRPCFRCGTLIVYARMGKGWRSTYWCPQCQPEGSG